MLQLLSGDADVGAVASWLGVDPAGCCAVAVCAVPDEPQARRLADLLTVHFSAHRVRAVPVVSRGRVDLALCDVPADVEPPALRDLWSERPTRCASRCWRRSVRCLPGLAGLAGSRAQAERCRVLRVLRRDGDGRTRVAVLDDVRGRVQATRLCELVAEDPDLAEGPVARLREWDAAHGTALAPEPGGLPGRVRQRHRGRSTSCTSTPTPSATGCAGRSRSAGSISTTPTSG